MGCPRKRCKTAARLAGLAAKLGAVEARLVVLEGHVLALVALHTIRAAAAPPRTEAMLSIAELEAKVTALFDAAITRYDGKCWLAGYALAAMRDFLLDELEDVQETAHKLFASGKYAAGVTALALLAKGNVAAYVPRWVRWIANPNRLVDQVAEWLLANQAKLEADIAGK